MLYSTASEKSATYYQESIFDLLKYRVLLEKWYYTLIISLNGAREQTIPLVAQNLYQDQILDYNDQTSDSYSMLK